VVDSNEVIGNYNSGIAIDRGFNNLISNNNILNNPLGIELWRGSPITGYENQNSQDYLITGNNLEGNEIAVSSTNTAHAVIRNNGFNYNQQSGVYLGGTAATGDSITDNLFKLTTVYHIKNYTPTDIFANNNEFLPSDTTLIRQKIYDKTNSPSRGTVEWYPNTPGPAPLFQYNPPCDMAEPLSTWYAYGDPGYGGQRIPEVLSFDSTEKMVGVASVKLVTGRGFDVALNYRPSGDSISQWSLTDSDTLYFWVRTIKNVVIGFQYFSIRLGDLKGNYYKYTASSNLLSQANLLWKQYKVPLSGGLGFSRSSSGTMSLDNVNYVEIHADTWDYGYTIWVDGLQFSPCNLFTALPPVIEPANLLIVYPNPSTGMTTISYKLNSATPVFLRVFDLSGREIQQLISDFQQPGKYSIPFDGENLRSGVYIISLKTSNSAVNSKMIIVK